MWLDLIIFTIFVLSAASGYRRGFVHTFIHTAGWLISLAAAYALYPKASAFLKEKTSFYNTIYDNIFERMSSEGFSIGDPLFGNLPAVLGDALYTVERALTTAFAGGLSLLLFNILTFLLLAIAVRIILIFLAGVCSKKNRRGLTGFFDGIFGLIAGGIKGIILIFLLLALLVPVISITGMQALPDVLESSRIAGSLYDNNLLFIIIKDFI
jgi:uncharacterized membrane protein required for colicin V production